MKSIFFVTVLFLSAAPLSAQNVGIGTTTPLSLLHVKNGTVLFSGFDYLTGNLPKPPISGKGTRMFWYADKAAFRTGGVYNSSLFGIADPDTSNFHNWDRDSIGVCSFAGGFNTKAKGDFSFAVGQASFANGSGSSSLGTGNNASGNFSLAAGFNSAAAGEASVALGYYAATTADYSLACGEFAAATGGGAASLGSNTTASGKHSVALGMTTVAGGDYSTSLGDNTKASGDFSTAMGEYTTASGDYSTSLGKNTKASGYGALAAGSNTTASGANSTALGINANTNGHTNALSIGGTGIATNNTTDNQVMMRFDNYTFWVSASNYAYLVPASNGWAYTSDRSKKEKFVETNGESVLKKIAGIPFYSWNFKAADTKQYRHYGIMAQDFFVAFGKDEFGEIGNDTTVSPLDMLGVAYSGIKALEQRTEKLHDDNKKLTDEVNTLKAMLAEMAQLKSSVEALKKKSKK